MKKTAQLFKSLSDDTRLRIIALLLDGKLCVCEIMAILRLPQSTASRHLAYLKNSGLVLDRLLHHAYAISISGRSYRLKDKEVMFKD